jgi:hypothetical protein
MGQRAGVEDLVWSRFDSRIRWRAGDLCGPRRPRCLGDEEAPSAERGPLHLSGRWGDVADLRDGLARSRGSFETSRPRGSILSGYIWRIMSCAEVEKKGQEMRAKSSWSGLRLPATAGRYGP